MQKHRGSSACPPIGVGSEHLIIAPRPFYNYPRVFGRSFGGPPLIGKALARQTAPPEIRMTKEDTRRIADGSMAKNLELLFDYTKFHISLYTTLTFVYIAAATAEFIQVNPTLLIPAVLSLLLAALASGIIAGGITQTSKRTSEQFLKEPIGPWGLTLLAARYWTWIEHTAFWLGLVFAIASLVFAAP